MKSFNRIDFKGAIGRDAYVRQVGDNAVAEFSVATDYSAKRKDGTYANETTWLNLVVWKFYGIPELSLFKKGKQVVGNGRLRCREYTDTQGVKKEKWEVVVTDIDFVATEAPQAQAAPVPPQQSQQHQPQYYVAPSGSNNGVVDNGDLPF